MRKVWLFIAALSLIALTCTSALAQTVEESPSEYAYPPAEEAAPPEVPSSEAPTSEVPSEATTPDESSPYEYAYPTTTEEDAAPPEVTITTPADGAVYGPDEEILADYACTDAEGAALAPDACAGPAAPGEPIDMTPGDHEFTVTATDSSGQQTEVTHYYTVESGEAEVTITTPEDGAVYGPDDEVIADYTCTDAEGVELAPEACVGPVAPGEPVDMAPGEHEFTVTATDSTGTQTELTHYYTVEEGGSEIEISTPADGVIYDEGQRVTAWYSCEDAAGDSLRGPMCQGSVDSGDRIDTSTPGIHEFTVTATDHSGRQTQLTHRYTVGAVGMKIEIGAPADGAIYEAGQRVSARYWCEDASGQNLTGPMCKGPVEPWDRIDTSPGIHYFTVTATNHAGERTQMTHRYTVEGTPGSINSPEGGPSGPSGGGEDVFINIRNSTSNFVYNTTSTVYNTTGYVYNNVSYVGAYCARNVNGTAKSLRQGKLPKTGGEWTVLLVGGGALVGGGWFLVRRFSG